MLDKLSKLHIVNIMALIILLTCSTVVLVGLFHGIPEYSKDFIKDYFNMGLLAALGWAFSASKTKNNQQ